MAFMKWTIKIVSLRMALIGFLILHAFTGLSVASNPECLVDVRWITVERQADGIRQSVRRVRIFDGESDLDGRAFAGGESDKTWTCHALEAKDLDAMLSDMAITRQESHPIPKGTLTLCATAYNAPPGTLSDRWWASYVGDVSASGSTHREFVLRIPAGEEVAYATAGPWTFSRQAVDADGVVVLRWVSASDALEAAATETVVPWILAGSRTTWDAIGAELRSIMGDEAARLVMARRDAEEPGNSAGLRLPVTVRPTHEYLSSLLSFFNDFKREAPTPGFRPRPQPDFLASRSGTCKEFSLALLDLLESQGHPAWLVFRATWLNDLADIIPSPEVFDHVEVAVHDEQGQLIILDPFAGRMRRMPNITQGDSVWTHQNRLFVQCRVENVSIVGKRR